jgi:hypothetical protein
MKAYGEWMYRSMYSRPRHQLEVSGLFHAPVTLPPVPIGYEAGWDPRTGLETWRGEKILPLLGLEL